MLMIVGADSLGGDSSGRVVRGLVLTDPQEPVFGQQIELNRPRLPESSVCQCSSTAPES